MDTATLTILFEDPFWVGLYQRHRDGTYQVCKITFGPEPRDNQVYDLLLRHWHELCFTPPLPDRAAGPRPDRDAHLRPTRPRHLCQP